MNIHFENYNNHNIGNSNDKYKSEIIQINENYTCSNISDSKHKHYHIVDITIIYNHYRNNNRQTNEHSKEQYISFRKIPTIMIITLLYIIPEHSQTGS